MASVMMRPSLRLRVTRAPSLERYSAWKLLEPSALRQARMAPGVTSWEDSKRTMMRGVLISEGILAVL